jgi:hypothetical protein
VLIILLFIWPMVITEYQVQEFRKEKRNPKPVVIPDK